MKSILYIKASPRGKRSKSTVVADAFIEAYRQMHPDDKVKNLNVFEKLLPAFDGLTVQAKYTIMHGQEHTKQELDAWKEVEKVIDEFKSADKYVLATPMWNFGIPYRLKQYIDILTQPGHTFSWSPDTGYQGLVTGKPMLAVYARGGEYPGGTEAQAFDLQTKYVELIFGFIGFENINSIVVEPTLQGGPDMAKAKVDQAIEEATALATDF